MNDGEFFFFFFEKKKQKKKKRGEKGGGGGVATHFMLHMRWVGQKVSHVGRRKRKKKEKKKDQSGSPHERKIATYGAILQSLNQVQSSRSTYVFKCLFLMFPYVCNVQYLH